MGILTGVFLTLHRSNPHILFRFLDATVYSSADFRSR